MSLKILGLNHNTAPVEIREQVVFAGDEVAEALSRLSKVAGVNEAVLLSTCNRTEFYITTDGDGIERVTDWLHAERNLGDGFADSLFHKHDNDALRHIFRVACGLDSMVLGEPQILGQLKDAYRHARQAGTANKELGRLFQHTFAVAKKVRTDTEIGSSPVSVAYAAVNLANQFFAGFGKHTALLVGAGTTIELVAKHLTRKGIGRLFVANRSIERARDLAHQFGGFALPLSEIEGTLPEADILITSTAAQQPILTKAQFERALKQRKRKPIFAVDIAVPRDIEESVSELNDVFLYSIDDLERVIMEGQGNREAAAIDAHRILEDEINRYLTIQRSQQVVPLITAIRESGKSIREEVLEQAQRRLAQGADGTDVVEYATASLLKKLLHNPTINLRKAGEVSDEELIAAATKLFGIKKDP